MSIEEHISKITKKINRLTRKLDLLKETQFKQRFEDTSLLETLFSSFDQVQLRLGSGICGESNMCWYPVGRLTRIVFVGKDPSFINVLRSIAIKYEHTKVNVKNNEICVIGFRQFTDAEKRLLLDYGMSC